MLQQRHAGQRVALKAGIQPQRLAGHRHTREAALTARTALCLGRSDLLAVPLQAGDSLRSGRGTVWMTVDGLPQDILLEPGQKHVVPDAVAVNVSALHSACASVRSARPLVWQRVTRQARLAWVRHALAALGGRGSAGAFYNRRTAASAAGR